MLRLQRKSIRTWLIRLTLATSVGLILLVGIDHHVSQTATSKIFSDPKSCPNAPVALVLGVAKFSKNNLNHFYQPRLDAAKILFDEGLIRGIVVSGDNHKPSYDEPTTMKNDLIKMGVPGEFITCDFAGFRTLDSVVRLKEVFGQDRFIVVSQRFHIERALFIARHIGCEAWGFEAQEVEGYWGEKVRRREFLARSAAAFDLVIGRRPRFLGPAKTVVLR